MGGRLAHPAALQIRLTGSRGSLAGRPVTVTLIKNGEVFDRKTVSDEQFDLTWFEEPCASRDDAGNKLVQERSPIPVAGVDSLSTRWEFAPLVANRTFDIVQPYIS